MNCAAHPTLLDYEVSSIHGLMWGYVLHCQEIKYISSFTLNSGSEGEKKSITKFKMDITMKS